MLRRFSSTACAELYGLNVLQHAIQDEADNSTRFICVAKKAAAHGGVPERFASAYHAARGGRLYSACFPASRRA